MNNTKLKHGNITASLICFLLLALAGVAGAATINLVGVNAPVPGADDQYQTNFIAAKVGSPPPGGGAFDYYVDHDPAPGQTFTTGTSPNGYILTSLALYDGDDAGGGFGTETFTLGIYSVSSGTNATLLATYTSQSVSLTDFNWFVWTNLGAILQPNTQYAYAMWANGSGWMNLGSTNVNFSGGQVASVPRAGGPMAFSTSNPWNADFDVGLTAISSPVVSQPAFSPYSVALPGSVITATAAVTGPGPYYFQWQTDGGGGGSLTNIPGGTSSNLVINTTGYALGDYQYALVVSNDTSSATGQVAVLTVQTSVGIAGVIAVKFGFTGGYATSDAPFPADNAGVATGQLVPPSYQPLTAVGNWNNLLASITNGADATTKTTAIDQAWNIGYDTSGNPLAGVTLTPSGFDDGWYSGGTECANGRLLYDCWKFDTSNGQVDSYAHNYATLTFANLPASRYDVYVYINNNNGNYWGNAQANSVVAQNADNVDNSSFGFNGADSDPCAANPPLHTANGFGNPVNYVKMPYVATTGGAITITVVSFGGGNMGISGVELVPSPDLTLTSDIQPAYAESVAGDQVVFTAGFSNSPAVNLQWHEISGGTTNSINTGVLNVTNNGVVTSTLTLDNVQPTNSGYYQLQAVNAVNGADYALSAAAQLVVSNAPAAVGGIVVNYAARVGSNFYPPWTVNTSADLIYGFPDDGGVGTPGTVDANVGTGSFAGQAGDNANGDPAILSDGILGNSKADLDACGTPPAGASVTYNLLTNTSPNGYEITNIQVYGGWTDAGRRDQEYQILYSTITNPTNFIPLLSTHYLPTDPSGAAIATRTTLVPTSGVLAHNVVAVEVNWNITPQYLNGYAGYSEIVIGGTNSTGTFLLPPSVDSVKNVNGTLMMTGSSGYPPEPNSGYTLLSTTNLAAPINWTTNSTGTFDGNGSFSNSIPISPSATGNYFRLRIP